MGGGGTRGLSPVGLVYADEDRRRYMYCEEVKPVERRKIKRHDFEAMKNGSRDRRLSGEKSTYERMYIFCIYKYVFVERI